MITTKGKEVLMSFLARKRPEWITSVYLGIGESATTLNTQMLDYAIEAVGIDNYELDTVGGIIRVKTELGPALSGTYYEVGIYSSEVASDIIDYVRPLSSFSGLTTFYDGGTPVSIPELRVNESGMQLQSVNGVADTITLMNITDRLEGQADTNILKFAVYAADANNTSFLVTVPSGTGAFTYDATAQVTTGYNIISIPIGDFVTSVGDESWDDVSSLTVSVTGGGTNTHTLTLDGAQTENPIVPEGVGLVSRVVVPGAFTKVSGSYREVIYELGALF